MTEYPFLACNRGQLLTWRKHTGPDFDVFYGQLKDEKKSGVGFYLGGHPSVQLEDGGKRLKGRLGAFDVEWYETNRSNQAGVYRTTVFDYSTRIYRFGQASHPANREAKLVTKLHAWVYGPDQNQVDELADSLSALALFCAKPEDVIENR